MNNQIKKLTYAGLMTALTFISTSFLAFPVAFTNGYIHLGDGFVLSCGVVLGKKYGALAAGIGSALADIYLGYASWALPTFIIKFIMAYLVGYAFEAISDPKRVGKITTVFSTLWIAFSAILFYLLTLKDKVSETTGSLIEDGIIASQAELGSRTSFTSNAILIAAIGIPLILYLLLIIFRKNEKLQIFFNKFVTFGSAGAIMMILYYMTYGIMYGNWIIPVFSVPSNLIQYILGLIIASLLLPLTLRFSVSE